MSTPKIKPDDFKMPLVEEAWRLRDSVLARSCNGLDLDTRTSMWVIRDHAWREFQRSSDFLTIVDVGGRNRRKELMGLPVRLTYDDDADVPMIQLVMEPLIEPRR